uniref:Protein Nef n=1 Tax=Simian immunodeficiency virus TaxID=11723 RepID=A4UDH9_SIV|nr:nef protein [Simian immunodeficiency virus]
MGSKNSKKESQQPLMGSPSGPQTGQTPYFKLVNNYKKHSWLSPNASARGRKYSLTKGSNKKAIIKKHKRSCPVRPQHPIQNPTYKLIINLSHFLKEKGGLEGMFYSEERHQKLETYAYVEWGLIPGWLMYTEGPGVRYPLMPGVLFCLRPVHITENSELGDDEHLLCHPAFIGREEDPHKEFLVFSFCSRLALKSGRQLNQMQQEERKRRLAANRILSQSP